MRFPFVVALPLAGLLLPDTTLANASLSVDDAGVTPAASCQLESWHRVGTGQPTLTLVPACTIAGSEWSLSLSRQRAVSPLSLAAGFKRPLFGSATGVIHSALSIGIAREAGDGAASTLTLSLPSTFTVGENLLVHVEPGWQHPHAARDWQIGIGLERTVSSAWSLLAELMRDAHDARATQAGIRRQVTPWLSIDLLYGSVLTAPGSRWLTFGINLSPAR